jgi:hypothetical protein
MTPIDSRRIAQLLEARIGLGRPTRSEQNSRFPKPKNGLGKAGKRIALPFSEKPPVSPGFGRSHVARRSAGQRNARPRGRGADGISQKKPAIRDGYQSREVTLLNVRRFARALCGAIHTRENEARPEPRARGWLPAKLIVSRLVFAEKIPRFIEVCPASNPIGETIERVNLSSIRGGSIRGETAVGLTRLVHDHRTRS